jgi:hypothetical protein
LRGSSITADDEASNEDILMRSSETAGDAELGFQDKGFMAIVTKAERFCGDAAAAVA